MREMAAYTAIFTRLIIRGTVVEFAGYKTKSVFEPSHSRNRHTIFRQSNHLVGDQLKVGLDLTRFHLAYGSEFLEGFLFVRGFARTVRKVSDDADRRDGDKRERNPDLGSDLQITKHFLPGM